jgi:hypothetical protein
MNFVLRRGRLRDAAREYRISVVAGYVPEDGRGEEA